MDDWARAFWQIAFMGFVVALFTLLISFYILIKYLIPLFRKKSLTEKESRLKSNLVMVGLAYLVIATIFYFIESWGSGFAFFYLPIICIIVLIFLQVFGFPRSKNK